MDACDACAKLYAKHAHLSLSKERQASLGSVFLSKTKSVDPWALTEVLSLFPSSWIICNINYLCIFYLINHSACIQK